MISVWWAVAIAVISGTVGILVAALVSASRRAEADEKAAQWAAEHAKVSLQFAELDHRAQKMFGKLCLKEARIIELEREVVVLRGEPLPGEPKAGGKVEDVATLIRDLREDGVAPAVPVVVEMEAVG